MDYFKVNIKTYIGYNEIIIFKKDDSCIKFYLYVDEYFISTDNNCILFYRYDEPVACIDLNVFDWEVVDDK